MSRTAALSSGGLQSKECRCGRIERTTALAQMLDVLVPEVLDRRGNRRLDRVAEGAECTAGDVVADIEQLRQVGLAALTDLQLLEELNDPVAALPARRALAARLVLIKLGPAERNADHAGGLVEELD